MTWITPLEASTFVLRILAFVDLHGPVLDLDLHRGTVERRVSLLAL
jgi:hypothetical protein